jgi:hypothetical protein
MDRREEEGMSEPELNAWRWLMALERFDWQTVENPRGPHGEAQVTIKMHPGAYGANAGAPFVTVLVSHPARADKRYRGSGNSLAEAVNDVAADLWRDGVKLSFPQLPGF